MSGQERGGTTATQGRPPGGPTTLVERLTSPTAGVVLVVAIVMLLVTSLTAASLQRRDPAYESAQSLLIDQPRALAAAPSGDLIAKLASLRVKYVSLLRSDAVIEPAAEALELSPSAVATSVRAVAPSESLLITVVSRAADAERAPALAEAVASSLQQYLSAEQERLGVPAEDQVTLTPLRAASPATQVEPSLNRSISLGLVSGLVVAALVYVLLGLAPALTRRSSLFR